MRVLIAGGIFRLDERTRAARQPTPEMVLSEGLRERGVEVETVPLERYAHIASTRAPDLVHVHHLSKAAVAACALPTRRPMVFTAHSAAAPEHPLHRLGWAVVARRMAAGVCLSDRERSGLVARFAHVRPKTRVIPNGLRLPAEVVRREPPGDRVTVLFVGQLIGLKRVDRIIAALPDRPQVDLRIVTQDEHLRPQLEALATSLGVHDRVAFLGRRHGADLYAEYHAAHVLALPSTTEALPSVVIEGLSTGLPVVASDVGGVAGQLGVGQVGVGQVGPAGVVVDPADDTAFAAGLDRVLADYAAYAEAAVARAPQVRATYSVDAMIAGHLDLYAEVLARD